VNSIFDKHSSLPDNFHFVVSVHLFKYWPHSLSIKVTPEVSPVFDHISNRKLLLLSHYSMILDKQISGLCVDNQYHSVRRKAKYTSLENAATMTKKNWQVFPKSNDLQIKLLWKSTIIICWELCITFWNKVIAILY